MILLSYTSIIITQNILIHRFYKMVIHYLLTNNTNTRDPIGSKNLNGFLPWAIPYSSKRIIVCTAVSTAEAGSHGIVSEVTSLGFKALKATNIHRIWNIRMNWWQKILITNPQDSSCPRSRSRRHLPRPRHNPLLQTAGWGWYSSGFWCSWSSNKPSFKCFIIFCNYEKVSMCNVQYV